MTPNINPATLQLDHGTYDASLAAIRAEAARLAVAVDRAERRVAQALGSWSGRAAASYAEAWADWQRGAREVSAALETRCAALAATRADLAETDAAAGSAHALLHRRLR